MVNLKRVLEIIGFDNFEIQVKLLQFIEVQDPSIYYRDCLNAKSKLEKLMFTSLFDGVNKIAACFNKDYSMEIENSRNNQFSKEVSREDLIRELSATDIITKDSDLYSKIFDFIQFSKKSSLPFILNIFKLQAYFELKQDLENMEKHFKLFCSMHDAWQLCETFAEQVYYYNQDIERSKNELKECTNLESLQQKYNVSNIESLNRLYPDYMYNDGYRTPIKTYIKNYLSITKDFNVDKCFDSPSNFFYKKSTSSATESKDFQVDAQKQTARNNK